MFNKTNYCLLIFLSIFTCRFAAAEILCPETYYIDVPDSVGWNLVVGPDATSGAGYTAYPSSKVWAKLTSTKAECYTSAPDYRRATIVHRRVAFSENADPNVRYFDDPWVEPEVDEPIWCAFVGDVGRCDNVRYASSSTMVTSGTVTEASSSTVTVPMTVINDTGPFPPAPRRSNGEWTAPDSGTTQQNTQVTVRVPSNRKNMKYIFDCNRYQPARMIVSSGSWHSTEVRMPATDVSIVEVENTPGQPRRFDVTCHYSFPKTVKVDFPRQTRPDNRDIDINLKKNGFYRVYDINNSLWRKLCTRECNESIGHIPSFTRTDGLGEWIQQCVNNCVSRGW